MRSCLFTISAEEVVMKFEVDGPPFADEGDEIEIGDSVRRGDVVWFDRVDPRKLVMRIAAGPVRGTCYRVDRGPESDVLKLVAVAQGSANSASQPAFVGPPSPTTVRQAPTMGRTVYFVGSAVWVVGVLLIIGNVSGLFRTFPFAGFLVTVVGFLIQAAGNSMARSKVASNPLVDKVARLVSDSRYQAAHKMIVEDAHKVVEPEHLLDRAIIYLEQNGIPRNEAEQNLRLILAALSANPGE
jgi:hypothetical protein